ncbi:MAG: tyrosyl-tRNA synthetase [Parcubacteria group bacterium Gr01-1014_29]|nr:MAG: tyrosyl-tRNA synthetase [Parcubacteria group bacterium Gr01-1014_29]
MEKIEEILTRSVDAVYPSRQALRILLSSGKQIRVYVGIDPTADYVHLGHSTNYLVLERLWRLGHKIIVLVGDFTAMIGDPSDKTSARAPLTKEEVTKNLQSFKKQIGKILNFEDTDNPIDFLFNSTWLSKLSFEKLIELASNFTVQQMLERDMFERRVQEHKPLYVHEFFYPLLQGYDSVALEVDLEVGGTDQTFNMLAGRTLARRYLNREKYVLATTLLVHPVTGEKMMSKSLGTGIGLNESPENMFGKTMALPDEGIVQMFVDCTRMPMDEINKKKRRLESGENPRDIKLELAHEIVTMYHGRKVADGARAHWKKVFSEKRIPETIPEVEINKGMLLVDVLVANGLAKSKTGARRLISQKAVEFDGTVLSDASVALTKNGVLRVGKKKLVRLKINK